MQVRIFLGTFDDFPVDKTIKVLDNNSSFRNNLETGKQKKLKVRN